MSEDWFEKYFAQLQQRKIAQNTTIKNNDGYQDVNASRYQTHKTMQQLNNTSQSTTCNLVPGAKFYRPINAQGWPAKFPLCKEGGTIPDNVQTFEYKGEVRVFLVEGNAAVDFTKIDESSPNVISLIELSAPFVGKILVQRSAIKEMSVPGGNGKGILLG